MARYQTLYLEYEKWKKLGEHDDKMEAERDALNAVHTACHSCVIVVEQQPVVVSRVARTPDGIGMEYPNRIMNKDYQ